jgi:hypothetical protein
LSEPANNQEPNWNDNTPVTIPGLEPQPKEFDRTLWYTIGGILLFSCVGILIVGYFLSQSSIVKQVTSFEPALDYTPAPTPNMPATETAWTKPVQYPTLGTAEEAQTYSDSENALYLANFSVFRSPHTEDVEQPGDVFFYDVRLDQSIPLIWSYGWCTLTTKLLDENFAQMKIEFTLNGRPVMKEYITSYDHQPSDERYCRTYAALVSKWPSGLHKLDVNVTFLQDTDDGWNVYPAGTHTYTYFVTMP